MKKAKCLLFGAMVGIMFVGISGCGQSPQPCNILVDNAKIEFELGDKFSLSDNMQVKLLFTNNETMSIGGTNNLTHDEQNKKYVSEMFSIDYSYFDSTKGGNCPIFVIYNDRDNNEDNNLQIQYNVEVNFIQNSFVSNPTISAEWTWGETPTFTPGQTLYNVPVEYYYKLKTNTIYSTLNAATIGNELKALNAGEYDLKIVYPQTNTVDYLDTKLSFTINRVALPSTIVPEIPSKEYDGEQFFPSVQETQYYSVSYSILSDFTSAGTHYVVLVLKDINYKWADSDASYKNVEFVITPTENYWNLAIFDVQSVGEQKGWVQGTFDDSQLILPSAKYGDVKYLYKMQGDDDSAYMDIIPAQFGFLEPGEYTIMAYIPYSVSYSTLEAFTIDIIVLPA